jgi:fructan beta-fructosidase
MNKTRLIFGCLLLCWACGDTEAPGGMAAVFPPYKEPHRPRFHFSPPRQWMNDPNGMVYFDGEYHLFYQYYPDSNVWGPMHWGHALSRNLVHWENMPVALYPDSLGYIFSGSAVVDWHNTSGFGEGELPPLVAIFTYHDEERRKTGKKDYQTQGIAYSKDRGRTWTKYEGNPVLLNPGIEDFRDPKVLWHEPSAQWIMALAVKDRIHFYRSPDLKGWTFASEFGADLGAHGGVWECPDLFELPVEGDTSRYWVLLVSINPGGPNGGSATQYFLGGFDGEQFALDTAFAQVLAEEEAAWLDFGRDNYAGVTWSDAPDGRRLFIGWMSNWDYANVVPTYAWRGAMTLPRELFLRNTPKGIRLAARPPKELHALRESSFGLDSQTVRGYLDLTEESGFWPGALEVVIEASWSEGQTPRFGLELSNRRGERYRVGYDVERGQLFSDRRGAGSNAFSRAFARKVHLAPRYAEGSSTRLHLFFDVASAELFADGGTAGLTDIFFPEEDFHQFGFFSEKGETILKSGQFFSLRSIWKK